VRRKAEDTLIRPMVRRDKRAILESAGPVVDSLYPSGGQLFEDRLNEVIHDDAHCWVAAVHGYIAGIAVEAPKGRRGYKISTFWVEPQFRRRGIGTELLNKCVERWIYDDVRKTYITVREDRTDQLLSLFSKIGFSHHAHEPNRYGPGRHEDVLTWNKDVYM